jgi:hypothetical protein
MTRADLQPLPKESGKRIELVRARHEVKIRTEVLNWRTEKTNSRRPTLTTQQQSELQDLLVAMSVELGETEGRERLSATPESGQFVSEIEDLLMIVAGEAEARWQSLTSDFRLQASPESEDDGPNGEVFHRVRELLKSPFDTLILQFWCGYEKRLQAEAEFQEYTRKWRRGEVAAEYRDGHEAVSLPPDGVPNVAQTQMAGPARGPKNRGRPAKIDTATKEAANAVKARGGTRKEIAKVLYRTPYPSEQQAKNVSNILNNYNKHKQSALPPN